VELMIQLLAFELLFVHDDQLDYPMLPGDSPKRSTARKLGSFQSLR